MTPSERVQEAFHQVLESPPEQRAQLLDSLSDLDNDAREEVRRLVAAYERLGSVLDSDAVGGATFRAETETTPAAVGPYEIVSAIGRGGQGTVYLARRADDQYQKTVAVKILNSRPEDQAAVRRFRHERQMLASIDHQFIARLLDGGATQDGRLYLVMEYVDGLSITDYCDRNRLPIAARLRLFRDVCTAVHVAHQNLIVHRDLKPGNVLVSKDGTLKLVDFGIAKLLNPESLALTAGVTQEGRQPLTPEYASPEQVRGGVITTASDVYSLGVLLYELLTGLRPYRLKGGDLLDVAHAICEQEPAQPSLAIGGDSSAADVERSTNRGTSPEGLRRTLRGDLDTIVLMAMQKQPDRRYASAEQLADDLARYEQGLPVRARRDTVVYRARKFVRRNRVAVAAASVVVLLLAGTASVLAYQARVVTLARDRAEQALDQARRDASKANAISRFLQDTLSAPNPSGGVGKDVTVLNVLERTADTLDASFASEPDTLAAARSTVGMTFLRLGRYERAEPLLKQALDGRVRLRGEDHGDVAESLVNVATLLMERGQYDEAEKHSLRSLEVSRRIGSENGTIAADAHKVLGSVWFWRANYAQAEAAYSEALRIRRLDAAAPMRVAEALSDVAIARRRGGKYDGAESSLREAIDIFEKGGKKSQIGLATTLNNLTILLDATGRSREAEPFAQRALDIRRRELGDDHPDVGGSLQTLSLVVEKQGDLPRAEALIRQALDVQRRAFGEHEWVAHMLRNLGTLLGLQGKYAEAERYLSEALAMRRKVFGNESADVADALHQLGRVRRRSGDRPAAERLLREALAIRRKVLNPSHPETADNLAALAVVLEERGDRRAANDTFVECLDILTRADPYKRLHEVQLYYGRNLFNWGRVTEAAPVLRSSLEGLTQTRGADHALTAEAAKLLKQTQ